MILDNVDVLYLEDGNVCMYANSEKQNNNYVFSLKNLSSCNFKVKAELTGQDSMGINLLYRSRLLRSALAKFRCGVAPIQLEIGRFIGKAENERLCPLCSTVCPSYNDIRLPLYEKASNINVNFHDFSPFEKYCFLVSESALQSLCAKICNQILVKRTSLIYV